MKKKIIFVTKALWIGGIETALVNLLNYLDYEKYDVTLLIIHAELDLLPRINPKCRVLIADREKQYSFETKYKYNNIYHLTERTETPSAFHKLMLWSVPAIIWFENRLYIRYIRDLMKEEHFDTAIIYSDVVAEIAIRAIDADKFLMFYHHGIMRHVYHDNAAYKKCEKIVAVSENQAKELKKFVPRAAHKIVCIHNLTNMEEIWRKASQPTEEYFDKARFNIVSVGRVSHEKGMDIVVRVCAMLVKEGFDNICWWIVGDGPAMPEVQRMVSEMAMERYVKLVGVKSNPYPYMRQADLYVQPSRFEGYPMSILEALSLGQAVVSTDNNGAREILRDGITGVLCPVEIKQIARAIEHFIASPQKLDELRENIKQYDFREQNRRYMSTLEALL